jgi:uncharacterized protein (DUF488 family)
VLISVGYEGRTIERFVELLSRNGVDVLVDVRLNAISRKPGFSKRRLGEALAEAGIEYVHEPSLGNPQENRAAFARGGDVTEGRRRFAARLTGSADALAALADLASDRNVAVLCFEEDAERCHRQVITDQAQELRPALVVVEV